MRVTVLRMISTNSLQAFSGAATTSPLNRPPSSDPIRLVRAQHGSAEHQAASSAPMLPQTRPSGTPPRGSLLNLSV